MTACDFTPLFRSGVGFGIRSWQFNADIGYTFGDSEESIAFRTYIEYRF